MRMKQNTLTRFLWVMLLACTIPIGSRLGAVNWIGGSTVSADVTNDNIVLTGVPGYINLDPIGTAISNHIRITADNANYSMSTATLGAWGIQPLASRTAGPVVLDVTVGNGFTFTFDLTNMTVLDFNDNDQAIPFMVTMRGTGTVLFKIPDGSTLSFSPGTVANVGTWLVDYADSNHTVTFQRVNSTGTTDANVTIGANSGIIRVAPAGSTDVSNMIFDPTNQYLTTTSYGRLKLNVLDKSFFSIQVHQVNQPQPPPGVLAILPYFEYSQIDFTTLVLTAKAKMQIANPLTPATLWSGLLVVNSNNTFPTDAATPTPTTNPTPFRYNPWLLPGTVIVGHQYGFVLGSNGELDVLPNSYLDYVGLSKNQVVEPLASSMADVITKYTVNGIPPAVKSLVKLRNPSAFIVDDQDATTFSTTVPHPTINMSDPANPTANPSAIYFRSGVDSGADLPNPQLFPDYTVRPDLQYSREFGFGSIVFDVEGRCDIAGPYLGETPYNPACIINILSLQEFNTGGSALIDGTETNFKLRSYAKFTAPSPFEGLYQQYGKACFLLNGRVNSYSIALKHTDDIHKVYEKNLAAESEPSYTGGESYVLGLVNPADPNDYDSTRVRPTIAMYNTNVLVHTSGATTGVDYLTPNNKITTGTIAPVVTDINNLSRLVFHQNGYLVDMGTGRNWILGSIIGSTAEDMGTVLNADAHYNVWQENPLAGTIPAPTIINRIETRSNNYKVVEAIPSGLGLNPFPTQFSLQSLFLAHRTNISLGVNDANLVAPSPMAPYIPATAPTVFGDLQIIGSGLNLNPPVPTLTADFISIDTQGGEAQRPDDSVKPALGIEQGQGSIFVNNFGQLDVSGTRRTIIDAMIGIATKFAPNAVINLPWNLNSILFGDKVGIAPSDLALVDDPTPPGPTQGVNVLIPYTQTFSDFTLNWKYTKRAPSFVPFELPYTPVATHINPAPLTQSNINTFPRIEGFVKQLQIMNSRLGDCVHLVIDKATAAQTAGNVEEFVFIRSYEAGEASVANIVLQDNAKLGLGTRKTNFDSLGGSIVLGIDGVTLVPNGDAEVILNEDVVIDNVCHIVPGPAFGATTTNRLTITAPVSREIHVRAGGVLDLSLFNTPQKQLLISGEVKLVFDPGSMLILGGTSALSTEPVLSLDQGGELCFTDNASLSFSVLPNSAVPVGTTLTSYDFLRVKICGVGTIRFQEDSFVENYRGSFVGIENGGLALVDPVMPLPADNPLAWNTNIKMIFEDASTYHLGSETDFGGVLQVGNTADLTPVFPGANVSFTLMLNGYDASFEIDSQGLFGLGVGAVDKRDTEPDSFLVQPTFNISTFISPSANPAAIARGINFNFQQGIFSHNRILPGGNTDASIMVFGTNTPIIPGSPTPFFFNMPSPVNVEMLGGGNTALVVAPAGPVNPIVDLDAGALDANRSAGIFISKRPLLEKTALAGAVSAPIIFAYLTALPFASQITKYAQLTQNRLGNVTLGYVGPDAGPNSSIAFPTFYIHRWITRKIYGQGGALSDPRTSLEIATVTYALNPSNMPTAYAVY